VLQRGTGLLAGELAPGASGLVRVVALALPRYRDALRLCACRHSGCSTRQRAALSRRLLQGRAHHGLGSLRACGIAALDGAAYAWIGSRAGGCPLARDGRGGRVGGARHEAGQSRLGRRRGEGKWELVRLPVGQRASRRLRLRSVESRSGRLRLRGRRVRAGSADKPNDPREPGRRCGRREGSRPLGRRIAIRRRPLRGVPVVGRQPRPRRHRPDERCVRARPGHRPDDAREPAVRAARREPAPRVADRYPATAATWRSSRRPPTSTPPIPITTAMSSCGISRRTSSRS
jgi:hypothetical protein